MRVIRYVPRKKRKRLIKKVVKVKNTPLREKRISVNSKEYREQYLVSEHWQKIKARLYKKYKQCRICGYTKTLNIHHITYKRLGFETDSDLIVVCEDCHINKIHKGLLTKEQLFFLTGGKEDHLYKQVSKVTRVYKKKKRQPLQPPSIEKSLLKKMGSLAYFAMLRRKSSQ